MIDFLVTTSASAVICILKTYLENSDKYCYREDDDSPYFVLLNGIPGYDFWVFYGIVYLKGQVFNFVGKSGSFYISGSEANVYWGE